jgi:PTS system nitrogen regulatory IIA component
MKLTVRDAAKMLGVPEGDVHRWIREGGLPVHRVSDHYRFHRAELLEWATARGMRVAPEEFAALEASETDALPSLSAALEAGGVHHDVEGDGREAVLHAVVARIPVDDADRELLYDFLIARERLGSTGVGDGIAIPHVRNPVVLHVDRPSVTLSFLAHPVDFGAIDGRPVSTLFTIVSPTIRSHLHLLSRVAAALHDRGFKEAIVERASPERIVAEARRVETGTSSAP